MTETVANVDELKPQAETQILKWLVRKAIAANDKWLDDNNVNPRYADSGVSGKVGRNLRADATEEFLEYYPKTSEDTLADDTREYINENYDSDFMYQQIEHAQNEDEILSLQADDLVMWVTNDGKYSNGSDDSYWYRCAQKVHNIKEMGNYVKSEDGVANFVERYAPDYQEHLQQQ